MIAKIVRKIRWLLVDASVKIGWQPKLNQSPGTVRILVFHGICFDDESFINGRFLRESQLDKLLRAISEHFHAISIEDLKLGNINPTKLNIVCTFDDGYKNNLTLAYPLFEKYNIPFTVFCNDVHYHLMDLIDITQVYHKELLNKLRIHFQLEIPIGKLKNYCKHLDALESRLIAKFLSEHLPDSIKQQTRNFWELLSDEDISQLNNSGLLNFGNHGANHINYQNLSEMQLLADLNSVNERFKNLEINLNSFAYPFGTCSSTSISIIKKTGFDLQFSDDLNTDNPKILGRFTINPFISLENQLIAIDKGFY